MRDGGNIVFGLVGLVAAASTSIVGLAVRKDSLNPIVCVETVQVEKIIELRYRDAMIITSDGKVREVYQATLKIGDDFCATRGRAK